MSEIRKGDLVQLVWACCAYGRTHIGWTGEVEEVQQDGSGYCSACGHTNKGRVVWVTMVQRGNVPISWVIKVEPPGIADRVETAEPAPGMNADQQRLLEQARRWSQEVKKSPTPADKKRAARKCTDCLLMLLGNRPKTELERQ